MTKRSIAATIHDVADLAQVSIKTVSRVVNREPGVRDDTRAAVLQAVAELNYRPKQSARSLAGARSFLIGLMYYDPSAAFVGGVQQGATLRCREAGYHLVVESLHNDAPDLAQQVDRMVAALRPDGMILTPPLCDNPQVLAALRESQTPCVRISPAADAPDMPSVRMDDVQAAEQITHLLISLGHNRIAFIQGPPDQAASGLRYQGYLRAMKAHRLPVDQALVHPGDFRFMAGVEAAHRLLSLKARPTAVFACNDDMALGVLVSAQRLGLSVPLDLSVAGFDDSAAASLVWPALTTVRQPMDEMARVAVDLLTARHDAPTSGRFHHVLPHELVVRDSTCKPVVAVPGSAAQRPQRLTPQSAKQAMAIATEPATAAAKKAKKAGAARVEQASSKPADKVSSQAAAKVTTRAARAPLGQTAAPAEPPAPARGNAARPLPAKSQSAKRVNATKPRR